MSNQEAIALLRNLEDSLDSYCELNEEGKTAFRMAIEALSCSEFPNSSDTIYRQAAINVADAVWSVTGDKNVAKVWDQIKDLPSAQPERKKGIWQEITEGDCSGYDPTLAGYDDPVVGYVCSCCRYGYEKEVMGDTLFNFCPNCGADMRGEQDESD